VASRLPCCRVQPLFEHSLSTAETQGRRRVGSPDGWLRSSRSKPPQSGALRAPLR